MTVIVVGLAVDHFDSVVGLVLVVAPAALVADHSGSADFAPVVARSDSAVALADFVGSVAARFDFAAVVRSDSVAAPVGFAG